MNKTQNRAKQNQKWSIQRILIVFGLIYFPFTWSTRQLGEQLMV